MRLSAIPLAAIATLLFLAASGAGAQSPATAAPKADANDKAPSGTGLQADPTIRFGVLPNGMRYAIRKNATPPGAASLRLRIGTGSLNEKETQLGLAHFMEHMVFNGTQNVPEGEFVKRLERHGLKFGPDTNASTDFEQTVYKLDLPATDVETVDTALFLLREVADKALLESKAIDAERGIVLAEERTRATPQLRQLMDELNFLYPGQLLPNRLPIGSTEVIRTAPRERFVEFYNAYYRPENAAIIAVGDFDAAQMEMKIRRLFGDWKGEGSPGKVADQGRPKERGADADTFVDPAVTTRASITWVRPADPTPDSRTRRINEMVERLGLAVLSRRLERIASTQSPAPFIGAQAVKAEMANTADLTQVLAIGQPGQWQKALATIDQEQRRLVQFGVTQSELDREIANFRTAFTQAAAGANTRTSPALAETIVAAVNTDKIVQSPEAQLTLFEEAVKGLTPAGVSVAVRRLFSGSGPLVYLTSPTAIEGDRQALLAAYQNSAKVAVAAPAAQQAAVWPYADFGRSGTVAERRLIDEVGATAVRFANGVRLTVKPTDFRKDEILVAARVGDGQLDLSPVKPPLAAALAGPFFALGGLKKLSAEDMSQALNGKSYSADFGTADDAFVLAGKTRPADFATQLQVLTAYLAEPGWQATGYDRLKGIYPQILAQLAATPATVWAMEGPVLLRSGDARWRTATAAEVAGSSIADVRALVEQPLAHDPIEVIVVGDITVDEAIRQTAATFGALPARRGEKAAPGSLAFPKATAEPVKLTHKGRADQGLAFIGWPTHDFYANMPESRALDVLAAVFQLRLTEKVREKEGVSYAPTAGQTASDVFSSFGYLAAEVQAPPAALSKFLADAQAIADDLRTTVVGADELQRALKPTIERIQRNRSTNEYWLNALDGIHTNPKALTATTSQLEDYQAVSPAKVQAAAQKYLRPAAAYRVIVVPFVASQ